MAEKYMKNALARVKRFFDSMLSDSNIIYKKLLAIMIYTKKTKFINKFQDNFLINIDTTQKAKIH